MAKNKTKETNVDPIDFIMQIEEEKRRAGGLRLLEIFEEVSGFKAKMWGPSIIGFGQYHYKYESGHEGDAPLTGFSPRKDALTLYLMADYENRENLLATLGKHKSSKGCVYIKKLEDVDIEVLKELISSCIKYTSELYPDSK